MSQASLETCFGKSAKAAGLLSPSFESPSAARWLRNYLDCFDPSECGILVVLGMTQEAVHLASLTGSHFE